MAFYIIEGFDCYAAVSTNSYDLQSLWQTVSGGSYNVATLVTGRYSGQAVQLAASFSQTQLGRAITASGSGVTSVNWGFAIKMGVNIATANSISGFTNGGVSGTTELGIGINASNQLFLWRGTISTVLATSTTTLSVGAWHYINAEITVNATTGTFNLAIDGTSNLTFTGNTGTATLDSFLIGTPNASGGAAASYTVVFDDLYVNTGSTRLGTRRIETLYGVANNGVTWTPLSSTNVSQINQTLNDGDTTYNYTTGVNNQDLFTVGSLSNTPVTIDTVQIRVSCRIDDALSHTLESLVKSSSTTANGGTYAVPTSYVYDLDQYATDPNTSAAWTYAGVNAMSIGYKLLS